MSENRKESENITTARITSRGTIIIAFITLIGTLLTAYWQFVYKPSKQSQAVETEYIGRVLDINTLQHIEGAKVTLDLEGVPPVIYTDSEGVYRFKVAIQSKISGQIRIDAKGYQVYTRNITISTDTAIIEDVRLTPMTATSPVEISKPTITFTPSPVSSTTIFTPIIPTSTETFFPPADGILFQDTFDRELKPDWDQLYGTWFVSGQADGKLTIQPNQPNDLALQKIALKNIKWNNYRVSMDVNIGYSNNAEPVVVVVRDNGTKEIGWATNFSYQLYLANYDGIAHNGESIIGGSAGTLTGGVTSKVAIEAQDDTYTLFLNGTAIQSITIPGYNRPHIEINAFCRNTFVGCPTFDNVVVTYLP
jgi:hypothetical protein